MPCFTICWWIFDRFLMKVRCKNRCVCLHLLVFFQTGDPHNTLYFTMRNLPFHVLSTSFFWTNLKHWVQNWTQKKHPEKGPTGTQDGPQIVEHWDAEILKITNMAKQCSFLRGQFFNDFLDGQKTAPRGYGWHWQDGGPPMSGGRGAPQSSLARTKYLTS